LDGDVKKTFNVDEGDEEGQTEDNDAPTLVLSGHKTAVICMAFTRDNMTLASGGRVCLILSLFQNGHFTGHNDHRLGSSE
jgi:hypothetical protein